MKSTARLLCCSVLCSLQLTADGALTALYPFNETSGNTAADAARGAVGDASLNNFGGTQWVPGKIGNALEFDGTDDYAAALNVVPTGTTNLTVSAWVWADTGGTTQQWRSIVKNWGGSSTGAFHFGFQAGTNQISNYLSAPTDGALQDPTVLTLGTWHHVAFTYSGGSATQTLYIDGLQVAQRLTAPADLDALGTLMGIGVKLNNAQTGPDLTGVPGFWDGKIDDLAFWNETLTPAEILTIKTNGDLGIGVVPEPASAAFLALSALGLLRRRR
jgi:hypothetical protein